MANEETQAQAAHTAGDDGYSAYTTLEHLKGWLGYGPCATHHTLTYYIMLPLGIMAALLMVSTTTFFLLQADILIDLIYERLQRAEVRLAETFQTQDEDFTKTHAMVRGNIVKVFEELRDEQKLREVDWDETLDRVAADLQRANDARNFAGWILCDLDAEVIRHDPRYDPARLDADLLRNLVEVMKAETTRQGMAAVTQGSIVHMVGTELKDDTGEPFGVVIFFGTDLGDRQALNRLKRSVGQELLVFDELHAVMGTDSTLNLEHMQRIPEAWEAAKNKQSWSGVSSTLGSENYVSTYPLLRYNGDVIGMVEMLADRSYLDMCLARLRNIMLGMTVLMVCVFLLARWFARKQIVLPMRKTIARAELVGTGDLRQTATIAPNSRDFKLLLGALRQMVLGMRSVILPLSEQSRMLNEGAAQLHAAADNFSNSANQQAAGLEEVASSMQQMQANIAQTTENSVKANKLGEQMNADVSHLSSNAQQSYDGVLAITKDITSIGALVQQTNILSLNAAVESARAGHHGAGFAVVAKEVGRLAEQTKQTADKIGGTARTCAAESEKAFDNVKEMTPMIEEISRNVKEITAASQEQNSGIEQINAAIEDLNKLTQQNAAGAEQIAASISGLNDIVLELNRAIGKFKL